MLNPSENKRIEMTYTGKGGTAARRPSKEQRR